MKKCIVLILGLALVISIAGCGKAAAETTANSSGTEVTATTVGEVITPAASTGEIKMDMKDAINTGGTGLVLYHAVELTQISAFSSPLVYGTEKITKNDHDMSLYYLIVNGYLGIEDSEHATLTLEALHERGLAYLSDRLSNYVGTSLAGTETSTEEVTVGGMDYLKVVGKSTEGYMQPNYIAYFGFYTNDSLLMVHAPIAIVLFIASDDEKDISHGEAILDACMATITLDT